MLRLTAFLLPLAAAVMAIQQAAAVRAPAPVGPTIEDLMRRSFGGAASRSYDDLVLGNSRIFRGVNPDKLGVAAYNFAYDNDSFNQSYFKLKYLEARGVRFNTLVLGVDYFEFAFVSGSRNATYGAYLGAEYLKDYAPLTGTRASAFVSRVLHPVDESAFNVYMSIGFTRPAARLLTVTLGRALGDTQPPLPRMFMRDNGQYVVDGDARRDWDLIRRDPARLPFQVDYFRKTLACARARHVATILVMPPVRDVEISSYAPGVVAEFDGWLAREAAASGAVYLNYTNDPAFSTADFSDITHLTEAGADKFSALLGRDLARLTARPAA